MRTWQGLAATEAVGKLFPAFLCGTQAPRHRARVRLAHSQETIVAALVVAMLRALLAYDPDTEPSDAPAAVEWVFKSIRGVEGFH